MEYTLKPLVVSYEVPDLDLSDQEGQDDLIIKVHDAFPDVIRIVGRSCEVVGLENSNLLFTIYLLLKIDSGTVTKSDFSEYFKVGCKKLRQAMEEFLTNRGIIYKRITII